MTASKDRVTFYLPHRYFNGNGGPSNTGMRRDTCVHVLHSAFGLVPGEGGWGGAISAHPEGFHIVCRPSQFARFIVYCHEAGECINGIRDLDPGLGPVMKEQSLYDKIAVKFLAQVCEETTRAILCEADVHNRLVKTEGTFDVSRNPHIGGR